MVKGMKTLFSPKRTSLALLLVMLFNPVIGLASSLFTQQSAVSLSELSTLDLTIVESRQANAMGMSENCHEHMNSGSAATEVDVGKHHSECCEDSCMCAQGGCYSTVAIPSLAESTMTLDSIYSHSFSSNYLNPTLSSQTPPPII